MLRTIRAPAVAVVGLMAVSVSAEAQQTATTPSGGPPPLPAMLQWQTTPSGLQFAEMVVGTGAAPHDGQTAVLHFTGWLADGTQFDSSLDRHTPFGFQLGAGRVIKGWDEGVRGMRVGGKRRLIVPPALGYGPQGIPGRIPTNATLTFDLELLRIVGN
jgi:FKBP-type peptidyl-prolyl cis-trans isomerase